MRYCEQCGNQRLNDDASFCGTCGHGFKPSTARNGTTTPHTDQSKNRGGINAGRDVKIDLSGGGDNRIRMEHDREVLGRVPLPNDWLSIIGAVAGIAGLFLTLQSNIAVPALKNSLVVITMLVATAGVTLFAMGISLRTRGFQSLSMNGFFSNFALERDASGATWLTRPLGGCPFCPSPSRMKVQSQDHQLVWVCRRHPEKHRVQFDFTQLDPLPTMQGA